MASSRERGSSVAKVKNKHAASVQITAEQLLREAKERMLEYVPPPPKLTFTDPEELAQYRSQKRKGFEDVIRRNRSSIGTWLKYAAWEESQNEIDRARSVYERALDVDHRNITLYLKYAEMEMKLRQINHARNIWDRAIAILPRVPQFWFKYTYMEEIMGNVAGARQIFERWMEWQPDEQAWYSYINFEMRFNETDRARAIYERMVLVHVEPKNWIKYAKFEIKLAQVLKARSVFERAVDFFGEDLLDPALFVAFAKFEESQKEYERARVVYKYALDRIPKHEAQELFDNYAQFERKFGSRSGVEEVIVNKRRFQYEEEVKQHPNNYDAWFDYLRLCEADLALDATRDVYERAVANVPPAADKRLWRRYIYLWIYYAVFEELIAEDVGRTRDVYKACLRLIPHKEFTFAKIWLLYAQFEIRQKDLAAARKALGSAIGMCPKEKLFKGYIELELQLREFDRVRTLYGKLLEFNPANCSTWTKFAELETELGDIERARGIYELAVGQPLLDMPEVLWKAYIDFESEILGEHDRARELYQRLLQKTTHVKIWISFANFEAGVPDEDAVERARATFEKGDAEMKDQGLKAERLLLLEAWLAFEESNGPAGQVQRVKGLLPRRIKRRRDITNEDGSEGWEEYYDYLFPDEQTQAPNLKLLQMAQLWKQKSNSQDALSLLQTHAPAPSEHQGDAGADADGDDAPGPARPPRSEEDGEGEAEPARPARRPAFTAARDSDDEGDAPGPARPPPSARAAAPAAPEDDVSSTSSESDDN